jgi:hypothetical protein
MSAFDAHPYIGNCILGCTIGTVGDGMAQVLFPTEIPDTNVVPNKNVNFQLDWNRTASIAAYSAVVYPLLTRWYLFTEALCGPTSGVGMVLAKKVALDEFVLAPVFNSAYLTYAALNNGDSVEESLKENLTEVMLADWAVWPGVMVVCFLKVPVQLRAVYVAVVGVGWNMFLAYKAHAALSNDLLKDVDEIEEEKKKEEEEAVLVPDLSVSQPHVLQMIRRTTTTNQGRRRPNVPVEETKD